MEQESKGKQEELDEISEGSEEESPVGGTTQTEKSGDSSPGAPRKQKGGFLFQRKKAFASVTATSSVGKSLFRKFVDQETLLLLDSLTSLITKEYGSNKAKQVKKDVTKLAVKVLVLYDSKKLIDKDFHELGFFIKRICSTVKNAYLRKELNEQTFTRVQTLLHTFEVEIRRVLLDYVSDNTLKRLKDTISFFADKNFMLKISKQPEFESGVIHVLAHYLEASKS